MYAVERLGYQGNYYVVVYRDGFLLPFVFGNRFPRRVKVRSGTTNLNPEDPRTLLDVLMEQTRLDYQQRGWETQLGEFSLDVFMRDEYGQPVDEPILSGWRYTPGVQAHPEYGSFSA